MTIQDTRRFGVYRPFVGSEGVRLTLIEVCGNNEGAQALADTQSTWASPCVVIAAQAPLAPDIYVAWQRIVDAALAADAERKEEGNDAP